jgi:ribokinase
MKQSNVFLFGDINLDVSMLIPEIPPPGQDVYVDKLIFNLGGSATNTCIALSQLGLSSKLLGSIGKDPYGDYLLESMKSYGMDTSIVQRKSESPSGQIFLTVLPDGERTMYSFRGANILTSPEDIPPDWINNTDLLHISGYVFLKDPQRETALRLIDTAHHNDIPISMDTGMDPVLHAHAEMVPALKQLDICICGQREGTMLTGFKNPVDVIHSFFNLGLCCVAIKLGTQGCIIGLNGEVYHQPALPIKAIDTTGSGDAYSAGVLIAWINQFSLPEMCSLANSLGAYAATQLGPVSNSLNWSNLTDFLVNIRSSNISELHQDIDHLLQKLDKSII